MVLNAKSVMTACKDQACILGTSAAKFLSEDKAALAELEEVQSPPACISSLNWIH